MSVENERQIIKYNITRLLASREQSRHELYIKLKQRNYDSQLIHEWLDKFAESDIQSDKRFAEMLVRSRINKGVGELRLSQELKQHQIEATIIADLMTSEDIDWFELAVTVLHKKMNGTIIGDAKHQQKYYRFLQQRGFSSEQIRYAIQRLKE